MWYFTPLRIVRYTFEYEETQHSCQVYLYLSGYLPTCTAWNIYINLTANMYLSLSSYLPTIFLSIHLSTYNNDINIVYPGIFYQSEYCSSWGPAIIITLFTYISVYLSTYLSIYQSTYLYVYLSMFIDYVHNYLTTLLSIFLSIKLSTYM